MNSYESFDANVETFNESGDNSEYVWGTEINGFESNGISSNQEVANFVRNEIPLTHVTSCSEISGKNGNLGEISALSQEQIEQRVVLHVSGELYESNSDLATAHAEVPSIRAEPFEQFENDPKAAFALSYYMYIESPNAFKTLSPEQYNFMRDNVFYGREYTDA